MSAATFLLILAVVLVVFIAYVVRSWFELGNTARARRRKSGRSRSKGVKSER